MTPSEVCKTLGIQASTLRKYSLLFEKEGITFKRGQNNSRIYTDTEVVALQEVITLTRDGAETLENAVKQASKSLKGITTITDENAVTDLSSQRHDDDISAVMLQEIRSLKEEIRKRDSLFVEALETMQNKLDRIEQQQLNPPVPEEAEENVSESQSQTPPEPKKGFFSRFFK